MYTKKFQPNEAIMSNWNWSVNTPVQQYDTVVYSQVLFEAVHNWPDCPIEEVWFLRYPHRHVFYIKAFKAVKHGDRDIEFIQLKHNIQQYLEKTYPDHNLGSKSCEMLASELIREFDLVRCDVSEDNENGAVVSV